MYEGVIGVQSSVGGKHRVINLLVLSFFLDPMGALLVLSFFINPIGSSIEA